MISKDYLYTKFWNDLSQVTLELGSLYLYAHDPESRSTHCSSLLKEINTNAMFVEISVDEEDCMHVVDLPQTVPLNSSASVFSFINKFNPSKIYLDVTGMSCRLVAPLLKCALSTNLDVFVVYCEPQEYLLDEFKKEGLYQDLSEKIDGVNPLPGFVKVLPYRTEPLFVTMIGFEGGRFKYLITTQQPSFDKIIPVVGIPGYKIHYPIESICGNRDSLLNTGAWEHIEYAEANSIVDSYLILNKIAYDNRNQDMVVAPIGTKPHSIGAILYAIKNPSKVELLYDNPKRKRHRTNGVGRVIICNVSKLLKEN